MGFMVLAWMVIKYRQLTAGFWLLGCSVLADIVFIGSLPCTMTWI